MLKYSKEFRRFLARILSLVLLMPVLVATPTPKTVSAFRAELQQGQFVAPFLYPPYPGAVSEASIFDHDIPTYDENSKVLSYTGHIAASSCIDKVCHSTSLNRYLSYDGHSGIDYGTDYLPIFAAADADQVLFAGWDSPTDHRARLGLYIRLHHPNNYETYYGHLSVISVSNCTFAGCATLGMYASPHGPWLAIDITCEASGFVQVINVASGKGVDLDLNLTQDSSFLNWAPTGNEIILRDGNLPNSRVYQIQINSGKHQQLSVPGNTYDIALSTNGRRMIYSLTQGLGYGSETWIADIDGGNAQRILVEPNHIIAFAHWSPSEKEIAYIRMPDSNIPFTIGELWVMGGDGENPALLGYADAGHGHRPAWSPDSQQIAFVVREQNGEEIDSTGYDADYIADKLISNIYIADLRDRKILKMTRFEGALTETPVWSPDGEYLAFNTTAGGSGMDIWVLDILNNKLNQVTHGANARHPAWLSVP